MTSYTSFRLAAIQASPVYFDLEASTKKACRLILEAGEKGANIAAFGETWLCGYPFFSWMQPDRDIAPKIIADYLANAVEIPGAEVEQLCAATKSANVDVVIGVSERDAVTRGTVYCTLLFISNEGEILGRHRKLKPTERERTVWGDGDASGLRVYERDYGKISGLSCWEHNMLLPAYALMSQGTQIHVAAWPGTSTSRHALLSAAFASQGGAYVIDVGGLLTVDALPERYRSLERNMPGESAIYDPFGELLAGPVNGETILIAEGSSETIYAAKTECDVGGHYSRPDIFQLSVNRQATRRVVDTNTGEDYAIENNAWSKQPE